MMATFEQWCRVRLFGREGDPLGCCQLGGQSAPDLGAVDEVARLMLLTARIGGRIELVDVTPALRDLLHLAGLGVEVDRKAKGGEEPLRIQQVQEEAHRGDLPGGDL